MRSQVLSVCRFLNAPETVPFRASSLTTLVEMVVGGLGVTLLPEMAVLALRGRQGLAMVPLAGEHPPGRSIGIAWRQGAARGREFRALGRELAALYMRT